MHQLDLSRTEMMRRRLALLLPSNKRIPSHGTSPLFFLAPRFFFKDSLGAGVATLATCYFLFEYDWTALPQTFCSVTAGGPRACGREMKKLVAERIADLQRNSKHRASDVQVYRLVKGRDVVATVPPRALGFRHIVDPVVIDDDGNITFPNSRSSSSTTAKARRTAAESTTSDERVNRSGSSSSSSSSSTSDINQSEINELVRNVPVASSRDAENNNNNNNNESYSKLVARIPAPLRDHMPDFYLKPLYRAKGSRLRTIITSTKKGSATSEQGEFGGQRSMDGEGPLVGEADVAETAQSPNQLLEETEKECETGSDKDGVSVERGVVKLKEQAPRGSVEEVSEVVVRSDGAVRVDVARRMRKTSSGEKVLECVTGNAVVFTNRIEKKRPEKGEDNGSREAISPIPPTASFDSAVSEAEQTDPGEIPWEKPGAWFDRGDIPMRGSG